MVFLKIIMILVGAILLVLGVGGYFLGGFSLYGGSSDDNHELRGVVIAGAGLGMITTACFM